MRPDPPIALQRLAQALVLEVAPQLADPYAQQTAGLAATIAAMLAEEWDRSAARLVEENAALRRLFAQGLPLAPAVLADRMHEAANGSDEDFRVSPLQSRQRRTSSAARRASRLDRGGERPSHCGVERGNLGGAEGVHQAPPSGHEAAMKTALRTALQRYTPSAIDDQPALTRAAVLVLLYDCLGATHVVFQRRSERVVHHKGQVSFPGGAMDPGDEHPCSTALRETHEEIGVSPEDVEVLGQLDDLVTISGFRVTPFVGWLQRYPYPWRFSPEEVAYLLEVPLATLRDPAAFVPDVRSFEGRQVVLPSYRVGPDLIWGATARIVANLLDVCLAAPDLEGERDLS